MPGSKLPSAVLKLGFNKMNSRRSLWLDDIKANMFKMERIDANLSSPEDIQQDETGAVDQVTMTQDQQGYHGLHEMEVDLDDAWGVPEEEEWHGIEDIDDSD